MLEGARESFPEHEQPSVVRDVAIGAVAILAVTLYRRRRPVGTALLGTALSLLSGLAMGAMAVGLFAVGVHRSWRATLAVAALDCAFVTVTFLLAPMADPGERLSSIVVFVLALVVIASLGMLLRSRRALIASLAERARQAEESQRLRVEEARLLERERIAREMHDVLAHRISLLAVQAGALEFGADATERQRAAAGVIRRGAHDAMEDLRLVIGVLRSGGGDVPEPPQPSLADVPALVDQSRAAGARVDLADRVPRAADVPQVIGRHAYRIVQEGLTNARRHAPGAPVSVVLELDAAGLRVEVANPLPAGPARAAPPGSGNGLLGLRERAGLAGGSLEHGPGDDGRWRLSARLPVPGRARAAAPDGTAASSGH
ncbi:histidine kinase [Actinomadura sp. PM05-2]|uniref:histidine kinase n=2 Tax=Actinomadura parmotrematis TaxID=2864039 RepID=A0ABS7FS78_9ACTN|nr:histidine kinase [Actinomadura parmotrematis]